MPRRSRRTSGRKKSGVFLTSGAFTAGTGSTRSSVLKAAGPYAEQARANAAAFSRRIPLATTVQPVDEQRAMVVTDGNEAPNAAPFEFALRHPLWGRWVTGKGKQPRRAYMDRAARSKSALERAAEIYAQEERDLLAEEHDYNE